MSLSGALSNALSGMTANARAAGLVSSNISNALTDGYGRRQLAVSTGAIGGVVVQGVVRHGDPAILSDRRISDATTGFADGLQNYAVGVERMMGPADDPASLSGRISAFENALITASSNPASTQRLTAVARAGDAISGTLNTLSRSVQEKRGDADRTIGLYVDQINTTLKQVESLNTQISKAVISGADSSSLVDARQRAIDNISSFVPVLSVPRENGAVSLFTSGGTVLLDSRAVQLEFTSNKVVAPHMTQDNGLLSGISINGYPVNTSPDGRLGGGALVAQFKIRDEDAVLMQSQLDGMARDMIERFGAGGPDTTIVAGQPGLFTDAGVVFSPTDETGLAGRIALNTLVNTDTGDVWRLRDGLAAISPGEVGNAELLQATYDTLNTAQVAASPALGSVARSLGGHASELLSSVASFRVQTDAELSFAQSQNLALQEMELALGVDTDQELQMLMQIEQNYAANARVMSVVDEMMQAILRI